jgi:alpha-1,2-mannosyltransferase
MKLLPIQLAFLRSVWSRLERPEFWQGATLDSTRARRGRMILGLALLAGLAIISVQYYHKVLTPDEAGRQTRSAFLRWRGMLHELYAGGNIYVGRQEYPNPPIMALLLWPFATLPPLAGALLWLYVKAALALLAIRWCLGLMAPPPLSLPGQIVGVAIALPALIGDLTHNNVNIFILFLLTGSLECLRRRWDMASGALLSLAIACKLTPLLFVPYFVWKRSWRVLLATAAGLIVWWFLLPSGIFGWERNTQLLADWYRLMIERPILKGEVTSEHPNQSLVGWTYRLLTDSPSFIRYQATEEGDIPVPAAYHNVLHLSPTAAWVLTKTWGMLFLVLMVYLCRTREGERHGWRRGAEYAWIVLGMLLLSERTWKHHAVTLIFPGIALVTALALPSISLRLKRFILASLLAAFLLMVVPGMGGRSVQDMALVYGSHTAAFMILAAAIALLLRSGLHREGDEHWHAPSNKIIPAHTGTE